MATYRNIQVSFWTDAKVTDDFTPEDRYFYLYLMTNPHTNLAGCYELSFKVASNETGYTKEVVENLIDRFVNVHNLIRYSRSTKEVLILNWSKFNWTSSEKTMRGIRKSVSEVKDLEFQGFLQALLNEDKNVPIPHPWGMEETFTFTFTDTDTFTVSDSVSDSDEKGKGVKGENPKTSKLKDEFEILWAMYPKKQGKDKAFQYYQKTRKSGTTYEEVGNGIAAYRRYVERNKIDMQYVKMGSTFFSQKSWQDDWEVQNGTREESRREFFARLMEEHKDDV